MLSMNLIGVDHMNTDSDIEKDIKEEGIWIEVDM